MTISVDVLLLCALKDEYDQVLQVTDGLMTPGWEEHPVDNGWIVADGRFCTAFGIPLSVRASYADHMGREAVQAIASKLLHTQAARCIAMSGICAGRRGKVALGDVIFADRLWSYDSGKITIEEGKQRFQGDMLQYRPSPVWVQRMQYFTPRPNSDWLQQRPTLPLENQEDWVLLRLLAGEDPTKHPDFNTACPDWADVLPRLWQRQWLVKPLVLTDTGRERAKELALLFPQKLPEPPAFQIHVAPMATGAAVTEDTGIFPRLAESMRKVLGVEMEASALGALGEIHDLPVLVAKAVSDFGDAFKDDRYRTFAARAAAECLIGLLRKSADLLPRQGEIEASDSTVPAPSLPKPTTIPVELIVELAELYPDMRDARTLWQKAGGRGSDVEHNPRPRDLWQRLWLNSMQGAAARPVALLQTALDDYPDNAVFRQHLKRLKTNI
jgi:nucleoside phosphorylase